MRPWWSFWIWLSCHILSSHTDRALKRAARGLPVLLAPLTLHRHLLNAQPEIVPRAHTFSNSLLVPTRAEDLDVSLTVLELQRQTQGGGAFLNAALLNKQNR